MDHPIPNTNNADSCQIIIPACELKNRKSDIYVSMVSFHHKIAAEGKYVAVCSTKLKVKANIDDAKQQAFVATRELRPALSLLGGSVEYFFWVSDYYEPTGNGEDDNIFISKSYDPSTHFESATNEVLQTYERFMGQKFDLSIKPDLTQDEM